jgi:hypothetical protein
MFVQTARAIKSDGTTLTLTDVTPSTLSFSDRPKRIVGHMTTVDFVDLWAEGDNNFEEDPPNAVLSFLESADEAPEDAVVVPAAASGERRALLLHRDPRGHRSHADGARHTVHRPVRTAALARVHLRGETARAATRPQTVDTRAWPRQRNYSCRKRFDRAC